MQEEWDKKKHFESHLKAMFIKQALQSMEEDKFEEELDKQDKTKQSEIKVDEWFHKKKVE